MKEQYFHKDSLAERVKEFLEQIEVFTHKNSPEFKPRSSALLVLDMQAYFLESSSHAFVPSSQAILPGIVSLVSVFTDRKLPVIFTQHINSPQDAGLMSTWWKDILTDTHPLSYISHKFDISQGSLIVKSQYDAFYKTPLEKLLKEQQVNQVVICGVMTHLCCESTARSAFMRNFEVFFPIDGTATYNRQLHLSSLRNLAHGFASIVTMDSILSAFHNHEH
ncbi:MAG: isochorismatase family protein [Chloroflexota bacterium]